MPGRSPELTADELSLLLGREDAPAEAAARGPVSDLDLVEAALRADPGFGRLALRVIHERTGATAAWVAHGAEAHVMTARGDASPLGEGRALAADLPPAERDAWARWLHAWMRLARLAAAAAPGSP